jgi:hypothetical protein
VPRSITLLSVLAGAVVLYLLARTQRGRELAIDAVELVAVSAKKLLPKGLRNNNPGNLRFIARNPFNGQVGQDDDGFGVYSSMALGVRAAGKQLLAYGRRGLNTVRQIASTWAPSSENDTEAYVLALCSELGVAADQRIDVDAQLEELAEGIFRREVGAVAFAASLELTRDNIRLWVRLP